MNDLTEFQQRAAAMAVHKMLTHGHFSISTLRELIVLLGRSEFANGDDMRALAGLHCVDYADMGADLARMTREKCLDILGLPPHVVDAESYGGDAAEPAKRIRLAFWRSA